jgi:hypothetical protein
MDKAPVLVTHGLKNVVMLVTKKVSKLTSKNPTVLPRTLKPL